MGRVTAPVPGRIGLSAKPMVGLPAKALPLATSISLVVPAIDLGVNVAPPSRVTRPEPAIPAKEAGRPSKAIVGLPDWPSPLVMAKPSPVTAILRLTMVEAPVLTIKPLEAVSRLPDAPLRVICRVDCAPPSTRPIPVPPDSLRLLGSVASWLSVRNVWVCEGDAAMAAVVVCTVWPFCTIGTDSVPVIGPA